MILPKYAGKFAYHFTHLNNLERILTNGFLSPNEQIRLGVLHHSIASQNIQHRRASMRVPVGPRGVVHDYVPFYLCKRSSMLLSVINSKNVDQQFLIYFAIPLSIVNGPHVVFTDASANTVNPPNFFAGYGDLDKLPWDKIDSLKWKMDSDQDKQSRMAEVLVHKSVDLSSISQIITWNDAVSGVVEKIYAKSGKEVPRIVSSDKHYYTKWPTEPEHSLVTGPYFTKKEFEASIEHVRETGQRSTGAKYPDIAGMLLALRGDLAALPETAELVGLESENEVHSENVGDHTLLVVEKLKSSLRFKALNDADRRLVELAAYLHDIGKGPKSRWASNGGKQKVDPDHPIGSVRMLKRILTEDVAAIKPRSVRVLAKLVCYHDLVGDILGKGRNPEQLEEIAGSERELDMLIALGLADMEAINPRWLTQYEAAVPELRERVLGKLDGAGGGDDE